MGLAAGALSVLTSARRIVCELSPQQRFRRGTAEQDPSDLRGDRAVEGEPTGPLAGAARSAPPEVPREAAVPGPRRVDAVSHTWLERLTNGGRVQEEATEELHALLVKATRFALAKRSALPQVRREALDHLAVEAADDALVAVLAHLHDYRGESRFTTWAWKFAFLQVSVTLRRRNWMAKEIPLEDDGWVALSAEASPERRAEQRELFAALKRAVEAELTPHQRMVFVALALNAVPVDVLADRMGTTRGALYKTLHDAREKMRLHLAASGLGPDEWRATVHGRRRHLFGPDADFRDPLVGGRPRG